MKLIKKKEATTFESICLIVGLILLLISIPTIVVSMFATDIIIGIRILLFFISALLISIGFCLAAVTPDNKEYHRQQEEIQKLKDYENNYKEYHKLKNKYKGIKI